MKYVWLDCDPGHDDATTIMLALNCSNLKLLGVSTVNGNTSAAHARDNAARCLAAFGAPKDVKVYPGAARPLIRPPRHDPQIHGVDGLGGVQGLPPLDDPLVRETLSHPDGVERATEGIARAVRETWRGGEGQKVALISTGPMTNIALFPVSVSTDQSVTHTRWGTEELVFMGGGVGLGNRSPSAEFNILCDPEAAQIVLNAPVKKTMIPLNVTHTVIVTKGVQSLILDPKTPPSGADEPLPPASTPLRHMLSTLVSFFAEAYEATFGFHLGPPLHDALTIAYIVHPEIFSCRRFRVDVELAGSHTAGETVVDIWDYKKCDDSWGSSGKNCIVAESIKVDRFFQLFLDCVSQCDKISPLNKD